MAGTERYDGVNWPVNQFWYAGLEGEETPVIKGDVVLMPHSGVASMSTVFPGVTLPEGCLIGAHSMVRHDRDLKPWYIHVGVPARPWRPRDQRAKELGADERRWKRHG
jgi:acetyltransferase-like isoleucine patch superfamily enzyme